MLLQAAEKFGRQKKKKPAKLIGEWMEEIQAGQEESMKKLQNMAAFYGNMDEFLDALRLGVESDLKRTGGKAYTADMVTLMTMHGAKGLEFPAVILVGAQKGLVPYESGKHPADQKEERRLFYVGMTRAKEDLILTYSGEASPYLDGLEDTGAVLEKAGKKKKQEEAVQMSLFDLM